VGGAVPVPALLRGMGRVFVGREQELGQLEQQWQAVSAGERRLVFVAGEPGVGKTRLAGEVAAGVHALGATVLAGSCAEDLGVPYQPFVEALRHLVDHTPGDQLGGCLGRYPGELVRLLPELAEALPALPPPLRSDPETERYRLFDAVGSWLASSSRCEPVLLVVDDLQWAAKPTLLLLRHVARFPEPMRVLVLGTYRDTEISRRHPLAEAVADFRRMPGFVRLSLGGLDRTGVVAFMEEAAGYSLESATRPRGTPSSSERCSAT
jgi:predicted ATPase